jgi:hypothetical protein
MQVSIGRRFAVKEQPNVKGSTSNTWKLRYNNLIFLTLYLHMNNGVYDWDVGKK